jgi:hypothetical protein
MYSANIVFSTAHSPVNNTGVFLNFLKLLSQGRNLIIPNLRIFYEINSSVPHDREFWNISCGQTALFSEKSVFISPFNCQEECPLNADI